MTSSSCLMTVTCLLAGFVCSCPPRVAAGDFVFALTGGLSTAERETDSGEESAIGFSGSLGWAPLSSLAFGVLAGTYAPEDCCGLHDETNYFGVFGEFASRRPRVRPFAQLGLARYQLRDADLNGFNGALGLDFALSHRWSARLIGRYHSVEDFKPEGDDPLNTDFSELHVGIAYRD